MYRNKLQTLIEENHIQHNEILNLQRQCGVDAAMAESWKIASKESELSLSSYETSLSIANEEIKILENNYQRLEDENKRLKEALYYADSIVYGTTNNQNQNRMNRSSSVGPGGGSGGSGVKKRPTPNKVTASTGGNTPLTSDHRRCLYTR
jgi:hypothetical protein